MLIIRGKFLNLEGNLCIFIHDMHGRLWKTWFDFWIFFSSSLGFSIILPGADGEEDQKQLNYYNPVSQTMQNFPVYLCLV